MTSATPPRMTAAVKPGLTRARCARRLVPLQHALEAPLNCVDHALKKGRRVRPCFPPFLVLNAHKSRAKQRHHRHGEDVGGKDRQHHPQRQRREDIFADAGEHGDREKDDGCGQRGGEHGQRNFHSALFRGHVGEPPISMKRKMFSNTTTQSSMSREKARASPPSNMVLIDPPGPW